MRYSCQLASLGETERALAALKDLTDLYEKFWSLTDKTVLTFRCPALNKIEGIVHHCMMRGPAAGPEFENTTHSARVIGYNTDERDPMWSHFMPNPLTAEYGWEWFDPIREDERYKRCLERMKAFIVKGTWNPKK